MSAEQILKWKPGSGWLVLASGAGEASEIRATVLSRAKPEGGVAYIGLNADDSEDVLEDMSELGAPTGYLVNVRLDDDDTIREILHDASIIVIADDFDAGELLSSLKGAAISGIEEAYQRGAIVLAEGVGASMFGAFVQVDRARLTEGLDWVHGALVMPAVSSIAESSEAQVALETHTAEIAVGIGHDSALALGPGGQVQTWGRKQVTIALGTPQDSDD